MKKAVTDTSVLINLSSAGRLNLLSDLFDEIIVPGAVWHEAVIKGRGKHGSKNIEDAKWLKIENVQRKESRLILSSELHEGESEAITIAIERGSEFVLLDDKDAREKAKILGLRPLGTIGILIKAYHKGLVTDLNVEIENLINKSRIYINNELLEKLSKISK